MRQREAERSLYCPRARTAFFYSQQTGVVILNGAGRSEESLGWGSGEERFFAALRMTGKAQFLTAQSIALSLSFLWSLSQFPVSVSTSVFRVVVQ
jgi:hypothetical protein